VSDTLVVTSVGSGRELDRVTLTQGVLSYETGAARSLFEGLRGSNPDLTDEQLFDAYNDWSNGYLTVQPAE